MRRRLNFVAVGKEMIRSDAPCFSNCISYHVVWRRDCTFGWAEAWFNSKLMPLASPRPPSLPIKPRSHNEEPIFDILCMIGLVMSRAQGFVDMPLARHQPLSNPVSGNDAARSFAGQNLPSYHTNLTPGTSIPPQPPLPALHPVDA